MQDSDSQPTDSQPSEGGGSPRAEHRHPLIPARPVDPRRQLAEMEMKVLERWREREVFARSVGLREGAERWVFYEGPPTANGRPGVHHVLSRVFKDIYPRYKTMRGYRVERKGGWDCHGLPVEIAVERELGLTSKREVEEFGIREFNQRCRESVFTFVEEWDRLTERIGFWIDLEGAYRTLDESYIESVWWALSEIAGKGLLYEGHRVVPYCPRCGTALSSHEVALGYEDVVEDSVYVRLEVAEGRGAVQEGDVLLIWTTTPWTLPGNVAVAVGPEVEYVRARVGDETVIVAAARAERVLGKGAQIAERLSGGELVGVRYRAPIFAREGGRGGGAGGAGGSAGGAVGAAEPGDAGAELGGGEGPVRGAAGSGTAPVIAGDFVTTDDGTGLVHIAPAFGEDDFRAAAEAGLVGVDDPRSIYNPVRGDGTYDRSVWSIDGSVSYEGRFVKDKGLARELIGDLEANGVLFEEEEYEHSYPHCWRCGTPLIYYAKASWYIRTTAIRDRLIEANETISWHPEHIKHGRFGDWLAGNVDWALSRERYWGTPLPVWRCKEGHIRVVGSFGELEQRSGAALEDHHRPFVDEVEFPCPHEGAGGDRCGLPMKRVPEVIDVWFDSGAMPFAQYHAPFGDPRSDSQPSTLSGSRSSSPSDPLIGPPVGGRPSGEQAFRERFPADFICEALDQTRGWFYSLLAVSTLLFGKSSYRNVVCLGLILDGEGQKMSKSRGNTVEPWKVLDEYGADAVRWYFFTSKQPWDGYRFSEQAIGEGVRLFLKQLWSTYFFYSLYANANAKRLEQVHLLSDSGSREGKETRGEAVRGEATRGEAVRGGATRGEAVRGEAVRGEATTTGGATVAGDTAGEATWEAAADLDRWALSRTAGTAQAVAEKLDDYDATGAGRAVAELVEELSNWYVRRSRRRFWDGEPAAFVTLRTCLLTVAKVLAPFCPFIADEIYDNLDGALPSVHLCDFPEGEALPERDVELEEAMARARQAVKLGLAARAKAKIKVRQPLAEAVVVADGRERAAIERLAGLVEEELNVKRVRFVEAAEQLGRYEVKPDYRRLGPRFGKEMPVVAKAVAGLDSQRVAQAVLAGGEDVGIGVSIGGREYRLGREDVIVTMAAPEGYSVEREGAHAVALELAIDEELRREGRAREIVHAVQGARRDAGLEVEDRISLVLAGPRELLEAAEAHRGYLGDETLAVELQIGGDTGEGRDGQHTEQTKIDGMELSIALSRAPAQPAD